ncbi:hypothetical protein QE177_11505 [Arsenophonus sp. aPb]|uniref:hypothetical protein n=1 Tax=Arsenophonus sp. aPb TaxID=3041619 RepID=UPI002468A7E5|nr:hypothetical protein [Arsenophonus sp. aPb]WGL97816.1 hypothetical protein QE177_11505 [Arsenophonus sp. aPb]
MKNELCRKKTNPKAKLDSEETLFSSLKSTNKGLRDFIVSSANIKDNLVQRGRIHGS